ncbi:MAG: 3,4-dihydroxy-2-butanone 4-phosphate synthase [Acidimicrobiales bacterium]|nr:3,4-dihydroxy-2-butanone 4-phosphate synthase [Acidimicrobiales bacterium]
MTEPAEPTATPVLPDGDTSFASIEDALDAFARGEILVVVDDEDRENEGDLIMAAEHVTPEKVAFFLHHTSGFICAPITSERAAELELKPMVEHNTESMRTAFLVSVDYRHDTTTGISSFDRAATVQALVDPSTRPGDLARPGHILPLEAREGGVLKRAGHTEATVDLARMAGMYPAGILCEIVDQNKMGMARQPELRRFAKKHGLLMISIADLIRYRRQKEKLIRRVAEARIPTGWGDFTCFVYESVLDGEQHIAMVRGDVQGADNVLVRVHSECLTGDVFGSMRCDCGVQLDAAMKMIADAGSGVIVYLRGHEGRGIGIGHKIRAYELQDEGHDTVQANVALGLPIDSREYGIGAQILVDLGITTMRIITNNPAKYGGLDGFGLDIVERVPSVTAPNPENIRYLRTKAEKMGHLLDGLDDYEAQTARTAREAQGGSPDEGEHGVRDDADADAAGEASAAGDERND